MNSAQEMWAPIAGYEGLYEISSKGRVKSLVGWNGRKHVAREKMLKPYKSSTGYYKVILKNATSRKEYKVHRLVAGAFISNPDHYDIVNHIDGDPLNNDMDNLEWCTQKHNVQHAVDIGLKKTFDIDHGTLEKLFINEHRNIVEIAKMYKVCVGTVRRVIKRHGLQKHGAKYNIDIEELKDMFMAGKQNKEIAQIYDCPSSLIARRRYQVAKGKI